VVAPGLRAAASSSDAPLTGVFAQQAAALSGADGPALADAACALGEIGGWMWAAEAAAQAAAAYTSAGRNDSARRALALSASFLAKCEDLRSPALAGVRLAAAELTAREREIVDFASHGATNAQIAEELVLSIRTVESHLYHAMLKLGARTRQELRILAAEPPTPDVQ